MGNDMGPLKSSRSGLGESFNMRYAGVGHVCNPKEVIVDHRSPNAVLHLYPSARQHPKCGKAHGDNVLYAKQQFLIALQLNRDIHFHNFTGSFPSK